MPGDRHYQVDFIDLFDQAIPIYGRKRMRHPVQTGSLHQQQCGNVSVSCEISQVPGEKFATDDQKARASFGSRSLKGLDNRRSLAVLVVPRDRLVRGTVEK